LMKIWREAIIARAVLEGHLEADRERGGYRITEKGMRHFKRLLSSPRVAAWWIAGALNNAPPRGSAARAHFDAVVLAIGKKYLPQIETSETFFSSWKHWGKEMLARVRAGDPDAIELSASVLCELAVATASAGLRIAVDMAEIMLECLPSRLASPDERSAEGKPTER